MTRAEYDLDVVEVGDIVYFEAEGGSIEGEVTGHSYIISEDIFHLQIHDEFEDIYYAYRYTEDVIGSDDYEIELMRWDDG